MIIKTYSEMIRYRTFEERFRYLAMCGTVGASTFGHSRHVNQNFYTSKLWRSIRNEVIIRDNGCDLADPDREIHDKVIVHHINPITLYDIETVSDLLVNPEFLVCVSNPTHNAIHFGDESLITSLPLERSRHDTSPWL